MGVLTENSSELFDRLIGESKSPKFQKTLKLIKSKCDEIELIKGEMTYSAVTRFAKLGEKTIANSKYGHYAYLKLRQQEYEARNVKKASAPITSVSDSADNLPMYPASGLDQKTTEFIDLLHAKIAEVERRNSLLDKTARTIQQELLNITRANPISIIRD